MSEPKDTELPIQLPAWSSHTVRSARAMLGLFYPADCAIVVESLFGGHVLRIGAIATLLGAREVHARRLVASLEADGWLVVITNAETRNAVRLDQGFRRLRQIATDLEERDYQATRDLVQCPTAAAMPEAPAASLRRVKSGVLAVTRRQKKRGVPVVTPSVIVSEPLKRVWALPVERVWCDAIMVRVLTTDSALQMAFQLARAVATANCAGCGKQSSGATGIEWACPECGAVIPLHTVLSATDAATPAWQMLAHYRRAMNTPIAALGGVTAMSALRVAWSSAPDGCDPITYCTADSVQIVTEGDVMPGHALFDEGGGSSSTAAAAAATTTVMKEE